MQVQPDQPEKVCAIVVTYHPQPSVIDNMRLLSPQVAAIVIVDNGSGEQSALVLSALEAMPGVRLIRNSTNLGIASALNAGIKWAAAENYNWVVTFDQDSSVTPNFIASMQAT